MSSPDPSRIARCSWILSTLFPHVSQIFPHTLLETRDFDLLATLETLVNMAQQGNFVPYQGIFPFYPGTKGNYSLFIDSHLDMHGSRLLEVSVYV